MAGRNMLLAGLGLLCLACAAAQNGRTPAPSDELALRLFSNSMENFAVRPRRQSALHLWADLCPGTLLRAMAPSAARAVRG